MDIQFSLLNTNVALRFFKCIIMIIIFIIIALPTSIVLKTVQCLKVAYIALTLNNQTKIMCLSSWLCVKLPLKRIQDIFPSYLPGSCVVSANLSQDSA